MTAKLQTYPKYKPSGIDWLGDIPEGWKIISLGKILAYEQPGNYISSAIDAAQYHENMVPVLTANKGFVIGYTDEKDGVFDKDLPVIIFDDFTTSKQFVDFPFKVRSSALKILKIRNKDGNDIRFIFRSMEVLGFHVLEHNRHWIAMYSKVNIAHPSSHIQKQIAEFLDEKTKVIDELMAKKEKLIKLLREKRAALITRAVTKGLDPNAKLKPSDLSAEASAKAGVDWIGDIPAEWEIKKLKFVVSVHASNVDKKSYEGEKNVLLCNYVDVYKNEFVDSTLLFMSATATSEQVIKLGLRVNDVLITKDSETPDDIGVPALVKETVKDLVSGYHLYLLRSLSNGVIGGYLFRFLQSRPVKGYFETRSNGVTRFGLSSYGVKNMSISIPSLPEQKQIVDFLDAETGRIDKAVMLIESQIEKLKEYRSSLIYHAVTGKIKV